jgi:hypothetical protein
MARWITEKIHDMVMKEEIPNTFAEIKLGCLV